MCKLCRGRVGGERAGSDGRSRAAEGWRGGGSRAAVGLTRCGRHWASGRRGDAVSTRKHARLASTRAPSVFGTRHEDRVREFCRIVFCSHVNTPPYSKSPHAFPRTEPHTHTHTRARTHLPVHGHISSEARVAILVLIGRVGADFRLFLDTVQHRGWFAWRVVARACDRSKILSRTESRDRAEVEEAVRCVASGRSSRHAN